MKAMKPKFLKAGLAGVILLTGISFAVAGNPDKKADAPGKPQMEMRREGHMGALPDLTEKQKEQIKAIRTANKASVLPIRASLQEKEAHLKTLMVADKADMGQIQTSVTEISDLKGKMMLERVKTQQEIRKILTPEQRTAFDSQILSRGGGHGRHGGMHHGQGHGRGHGDGHGGGKGYHKGGMDRGGNQGRPTPPPADK